MVFSPTIVPWLCLTADKETLSDMGSVDEVRAFNHLPVIESAELAGCPRPKFWDDWFDHQKDDAYWRALSIERRLDRVKVPVLGIAGWYDDARGTIRNYVGIDEAAGPSAAARGDGRRRPQGNRLRERRLRPAGRASITARSSSAGSTTT